MNASPATTTAPLPPHANAPIAASSATQSAPHSARSAALPAPSVLLMGPPGTGKTYSIATLLEAGLEVFVIMTEPGAAETLLDACATRRIPLDKLHYAYVPPVSLGIEALSQLASRINTFTYEDLTKIKTGISKPETTNIMKIFRLLENFIDDRTGQSFGNIGTWDASRALVLDSLSGLNLLAMQNTVGMKPAPAPGEWGVAMNLEEQIITLLTAQRFWFVLLAHIDRNADEVSGAMNITPSALGSKLGPKLGRFFSEVALTRKEGSSFYWSTVEPRADVKSRALGFSATLAPSFAPLVKAYAARVAATGAA